MLRLATDDEPMFLTLIEEAVSRDEREVKLHGG